MPSLSLQLHLAGHAVLRSIARPVVRAADRSILSKLQDEMRREILVKSAAGLAAPQLGISLRAFMVAPVAPADGEPWMAINPSIVRRSRATTSDYESCLSVPHYAAEVRRARSVEVQFEQMDGRLVSKRLSGWDARVFQHELDHLDGVLFTDRADLSSLLHESFYTIGEEESDAQSSDGETAAAAGASGRPESEVDFETDEHEYYDEYEYEEEEEWVDVAPSSERSVKDAQR